MSYRTFLLSIVILMFLPAISFAQDKVSISGTVYLPKEKDDPGSQNDEMESRFTAKPGVIVRIKEVDASGNTSDDFIDFQVTNSRGKYTISVPGNKTYKLFAKYGPFVATKVVTLESANQENINIELKRPGIVEISRAIVAYQQSGASSAERESKFFVDLHVEMPFKRKEKDDSDLGPRFRTWGNFRITSVPQQIQSSVNDFVVKFAEEFGKVKVNEIAQAVEFLAGTELRIFPWKSVYASETGSHDIPSINLIVGGGVITPFTPRDVLQVFAVSDEARTRLQIPVGKDFVAFVTPERDRFFRQFYGGVRIKTRYFKDGSDTGRYDSMFDITYGINESVTGGRAAGGVMRLEGFYALPVVGRVISLFGTAYVKPVRSNMLEPLILSAAPSTVTVPASNVAIVPIKQINRDYYRIGAGIDLAALIDLWKK